jgi:hypothetical protein
MEQFFLWLMQLLGVRPEHLLVTAIILLGGAVLLILALLFSWADRHSPK